MVMATTARYWLDDRSVRGWKMVQILHGGGAYVARHRPDSVPC
jgi:hypothetical protein